MSNYTKATNFAVKDGLTTGDPDKKVKGTEIDNEFNAIASAISSKADANSPTLTGTPLAPTASAGTDNTQIATTAFVQTALASFYPVGSIYINASVSTNPGTLLGFGTWTAFGAGRVMVGLDGSNSAFDTAEETGGSANAIVVSHTHTGTTGSGSAHSHNVVADTSNATGGSPWGGGTYVAQYGSAGDSAYRLRGTDSATPTVGQSSSESSHTHTFTTDSSGSSGTNANLQPYIVVYMWKRTA